MGKQTFKFNTTSKTPYVLYSILYPRDKTSPYKDNLVNIKGMDFTKYKYNKIKNEVIYK